MAALKIFGFFALGLAILAVAAVGVWVYVVQNVEQPDYALVERDGDIEIRDYPAMIVAEVTRRGPRREAVSNGFRPLAGYIFAKDRAGETVSMTAPVTQRRDDSTAKIAMTAPVTQTPAGESAQAGTWKVRFIMPSGYTLETLPRPGSDDVRLVEVTAKRRAAIRFSGHADDASIAKNEARLAGWLADKGHRTEGPPTYAYYNDPWTPGPLRRNEVIFDLAAPADAAPGKAATDHPSG